MSTQNDLVRLVISSVGGQVALANALGVKQQTVSDWAKRGRFPTLRVLAIEKLTGFPRHELRPDIYPSEAGSASA